MFFMLKKSWPGTFRRTILDKDKLAVGLVILGPGEVVEVVDKEEIDFLSKDLGKALIEWDPSSTIRPVVVTRESLIDPAAEAADTVGGDHSGDPAPVDVATGGDPKADSGATSATAGEAEGEAATGEAEAGSKRKRK